MAAYHDINGIVNQMLSGSFSIKLHIEVSLLK